MLLLCVATSKTVRTSTEVPSIFTAIQRTHQAEVTFSNHVFPERIRTFVESHRSEETRNARGPERDPGRARQVETGLEQWLRIVTNDEQRTDRLLFIVNELRSIAPASMDETIKHGRTAHVHVSTARSRAQRLANR